MESHETSDFFSALTEGNEFTSLRTFSLQYSEDKLGKGENIVFFMEIQSRSFGKRLIHPENRRKSVSVHLIMVSCNS